MMAWTDYPILDAGDKPYKPAPVRKCEILSYDRNKYCQVKVSGVTKIQTIKAGYLYTTPGRLLDVKPVPISLLRKLPHEV